MKTHYAPYIDDDEERAICGVFMGEGSEQSWEWSEVSCGRCLRNRAKIDRAVDLEAKEIVRQMGEMAKHMSQA